ncbi:MAG: hypothetical protein ACODAC_00590 [Pseudomonadota bacterium]
MAMKHTVFGIFLALLSAACSTTPSSSSTPVESVEEAWEGSVLITQERLPDDVSHTVIGAVQAEARAGYSGAESLYPLLAEEARDMGANAVVNAEGGRKVSAFSWAAPFVRGTAIRVDDPQDLEGIEGAWH